MAYTRLSTTQVATRSRRRSVSADSDPDPLPLWYQRGLVVVVSIVVWVGGIGLLLAVIGDYALAPVLAIGLVGAAVTIGVAWPARGSHQASRSAVWAAIAMCVVAVGFAGWNARYAGHHVAIGRDPGIYSVTGKWIAVHGNLDVHSQLAWTTKSANVTAVYEGSYPRGPDVTQFQFDHLTPVLFAVADNVGGDRLLFRTPAILGALALAAVYAAGCRLVRKPWLVLAAVTGLAVSLPQINVTRDTFSEPAIELLLWGGVWLLLIAYERGQVGIAFLAGAALAGTMMDRIDALVYLIPAPLLGGLAWVLAREAADRRRLASLYGAFLIGAVPVVVLATIDVQNRAGHYYDDLHSDVHQLQVGFAVSAILAVAVVLLWPLWRSVVGRAASRLAAYRGVLSGAGAGLAIVAGLAAWLVRPHVLHAHGTAVAFVGGLQHLDGLPFDPTRTYAEYSVVWLGWYLGPVTIALAIVGAGLAVWRVIDRFDPAACLVLALTGLGTALYLWKPSIFPDQIWAMRRFVPAAMPLLVLLAALALACLADLIANRTYRGAGPPVALIGAAAMIALPLHRTWPVRDFQPNSGTLAAIQATCQATGPKAALLTAANDFPSQELVGALRSWCNVPVATMLKPFSPADLHQLATKWDAAGRTLWIVGSSAKAVAASSSGPQAPPKLVAVGRSPHELEVVLQSPPQHYNPGSFNVYASRVSP